MTSTAAQHEGDRGLAADRRDPPLDHPDYLSSKALASALQRAIERELAGRSGLDVLDVGCGHKPFELFFRRIARSYIGTEIAPGPQVDRVCPAEKLDVRDASIDVVICLSVLEHVDDPEAACRELARVLRSDGVALVATHGCFPWHPYPQDHWRWTQTGLVRVLERAGFRRVTLEATRGSISGIFFLLAHEAHRWALARERRNVLRGPLVRTLNRLGEWLDARARRLADPQEEVTAIPDFFVVARP